MRRIVRKILVWAFPELGSLVSKNYDLTKLRSWQENVKKGKNVRINPVHVITDVEIGDYSYVSDNSVIANTSIGKFCSIGPNFMCGWGLHPTDGLSTSPVFYSTKAKYSFSAKDKFDEHQKTTIGNDVFIGANVTVLDGVSIGDGAIIGAGAVVSKDIPPYAIAFGVPIQIRRYRFSDSQIENLKNIRWWDFDEEKLRDVEQMFYDVDAFIQKYSK